jgi:DNA-binding MarR family transcriptional regulator
MKKNKVYTEKQLEILRYVNDNGGVKVPVYPRLIKQNKNFYARINRLEFDELVTLTRYDGFASDFTITEKGKELLQCCSEEPTLTSKIEAEDNFKFLDNLLCSNKLSQVEKEKLLSILVS